MEVPHNSVFQLQHLRVAAAVGQRAYSIAERELHGSQGIGVATNDCARNFEARNIAGSRRRVVIALSLQNVWAIHSTVTA